MVLSQNWGGFSLPYGKTTPPPKKRSREVKCIIVTSTDMSSSCEPVAAVRCFCLTDFIDAKVYWSSKIYIQDYISGIIGELSSFLWLPSLYMTDVIGYMLSKFVIVPIIAVTLLILFFIGCTVEVTPCAWPHIITT